MEYGTFNPRVLRPARTYWIDNFRTYLTVLVIYHHTALAYGGAGNQTYKSKHHPPSAGMLLFNAINQSYFMAAFFFLSGHFMAVSARRKSIFQLLKDRYIRLGIPVLLYPILLQPLITVAKTAIMLHEPVTFKIFTDHWRHIRGVQGPLWYCAVCLIFDTCFALVRWLSLCFSRPGDEPTEVVDSRSALSRATRFVLIFCGLLASALLSFIIRTFCPGMYVFIPLGLLVGYLPQYILYYSLGHLTPTPLIPSYLNPFHLVTVCFITLIIAVISSGVVTSGIDDSLGEFNRGNPSVIAFYVLENEMLGYCLFWKLLDIFFFYCRAEMPLRMARYSYAAFIIHMPVSQTIEMLLDGWLASAWVKLLAVGTLNVVASWVVGMILAQLPLVKRVIG
jgi:glucans biosynthesis protein C